RLTSRDVFLSQTVAELALAVSAAEPVTARPVFTGPAPLTPIQRWFFETHGEQPHFTMSLLIDVAADLDADALAGALAAVLKHHDALRNGFRQSDGKWLQEPNDNDVLLLRHDLSNVAESAVDGRIAELADAVRAELDIAAGPLLRAALLDVGANRAPRLLITVHHLVMDGVSWRILLDDLVTAYGQIKAGQAVALAEVGTSFGEWAHRLQEHVAEGGLAEDLDHWLAVPPPVRLPVDHDGENRAATTESVTVRLDRAATDAVLHQVPALYRTQVNDVLLSALGQVMTRWLPGQAAITLEGHGREEILDGVDLSRTVGWFTTQFPVSFTVPHGDWGTILKSVKEQLRAVPHKGLSYEALRYLLPDSPLAGRSLPEICFNYHGQLDVTGDGLIGTRHAESGAEVDPSSTRDFLLDVSGVVENGELALTWQYSSAVHDETTVRGLAEAMVAALSAIVEHCAEPGAGGRTPSDFPLASLTQSQVDVIARDGVDDIYPLTPLQAGMVFHSLVEPDGGAYVDQVRLVLDGVSDPDALADAFQRVVDRNPVLRTSVVWEGVDEPVQVVHNAAPLRTIVHDLRDHPDRDSALADLLAADRERGFDLDRAPLLRVEVVRWTDDRVVLVWSSHHVLLDGWSTGQVFGEVCAEYEALSRGLPSVPPVRRPFREYLRWLARQDTDAADAHWQQVLAGFDSPVAVPYDRPPTHAHRTESSESVKLTLTRAESERVRAAAQATGLTVNTAVQGAWAILLSRWAGTDDVVFGSTVSGRPAELAGVESMVGMFINTVPTRVKVDPAQPTGQWLRDLQAAQSESRRFDFLALPRVQAHSDVSPGTALFDSVVVFENYPFEDASSADGLRVAEVHAVDTTNLPLTLSAHLDDRVHLDLAYDPALLDDSSARRVSEWLRSLLIGLAEGIDAPVGDLPWMSTEDRERVLTTWNDTALRTPEMLFPEVFERQAALTPEAVAVVCGDTALTFA
ncbi:MAG: condensation domain-containing protein, partial [Actinomycetota bacterium]|nr:condensation domain-containing protein [Actinomycetota bacterium]